MQTTTEIIEQLVSEALTRKPAFAYFGDLPLPNGSGHQPATWGYTRFMRHRDSSVLANVNFDEVSTDLLERFPEDVEVMHTGCSLVGWRDELVARVKTDDGQITDAFRAVCDWTERLDEEFGGYPVADEDKLAMAEEEDAIDTIANCYYDLVLDSVKDDIEDWADRVASEMLAEGTVCAVSFREDDVREALIRLGWSNQWMLCPACTGAEHEPEHCSVCDDTGRVAVTEDDDQ